MSFLENARHNAVDMVMPVPPMSMRDVELQAARFLSDHAPRHLQEALPLDLVGLVEHVLPPRGIHFMPVSDEELPGMYARTSLEGRPGDQVEVLVRQSEWYALFPGGRLSHHPRGTFAHELGHVVLHVPNIRRRVAHGLGLPRAQRNSTVKAFNNPEWQAWAFAGCILAPRTAINRLTSYSVAELATQFATSDDLMERHLHRLKITRRRY